MAWYPYSYKTAFDPTTGEKAPAGSAGQIYAIGDTGFTTPLQPYDLAGLPVELAVQGDLGYIPTFQVEDETSVVWKSGDYIFEFTTTMPLPGPEGPSIVNAVEGDGTVTFELTDGSTVGPVDLPEGPEGPRGPAGYNATGAVEDQQTLADYVNETAGPNPFSGALSATYGRPVLNVEHYGVVDKTGATDSSAAVKAANADALAKGATLEFPRGIIRIDEPIIFEQVNGKQNSVRWTGQGRTTNWANNGGTGGTVLDLRYAGGLFGHKIETYGQGLLEIDHLTLADDGTSTTPYLLTTGTTLHAHDIAVTGNPSKSRFTCDQDVFILGGLEGTTGNDGPNEAFQGYGTVIERVLFEKIRTGVMVRRFANSVIIGDLSFSNRCGSNNEQGAVEINPGTGAAVPGGEPVAFAYGNIIRDCLVEVMGYLYGMRFLNKAEHNVIRGNSFWDAEHNGAYVADYYFGATASGNVITDPGVQTQGKALIDESGQNFWTGPMFGSTGYVQTMTPGNQGFHLHGQFRTQHHIGVYDDILDPNSYTARLSATGLELRNASALRIADNAGAFHPIATVTSSNQVLIGDVFDALSNQSVIFKCSPNGSMLRFRVGPDDKILVSADGVGFNGATPVHPELTYSLSGETDAQRQIRVALRDLGLIADNTVA